ncbi:hypothetical protein Tco_0827214 [Tanacetum coccineum]
MDNGTSSKIEEMNQFLHLLSSNVLQIIFCIPLWTADPLFSHEPKSSHGGEINPSACDVGVSDDEDDGAVADMNNLDTTIQVSPNPTTRIHKDHPLDQVIRDLQSATKNLKRCLCVSNGMVKRFFSLWEDLNRRGCIVCQPLGIQDPYFPDRDTRLKTLMATSSSRAWFSLEALHDSDYTESKLGLVRIQQEVVNPWV